MTRQNHRTRVLGLVIAVAIAPSLRCGLTQRPGELESRASTSLVDPDPETDAIEHATWTESEPSEARIPHETSFSETTARPTTLAESIPTNQAHTLAQLRTRYRAQDLRLIADVQRQIGHEAPEAVKDLIRMRADGASREQIAEAIDQTIHGLRVRAMCRRWLAREFDEFDPPLQAFGRGGRSPTVHPIVRDRGGVP